MMKTENIEPRYVIEPAPEPEAFRFANGERAASLDELARLLPALPDHVLDYHRAHFAAWLRDVVRDAPLAERFRQFGESGMATDEYRRVLADLVTKRVAELTAPAKKPAKKAGASKKGATGRRAKLT